MSHPSTIVSGMLLFFMFIMVLVNQDALAGCYPPAGPTQERSGGVVTQHSYATNALICIYDFERRTADLATCEQCQSGKWHRCDLHGRWIPQHSCSQQEAKSYINGYQQQADSDQKQDQPNFPDRAPRVHDRQPDRLSPSAKRSNTNQQRCQQLRLQVVEEIQKGYAFAGRSLGDSAGICASTREFTRVLEYAIENMKQYGCYQGEYDDVLQLNRTTAQAACE